jgi:hypothetical protein
MNIPFKLPQFLESPKWVLLGSTLKNTALAINLALASSVVAAQSSSEPVTSEPLQIERVITNAVPLVTDLQTQTPLEFFIEPSQSDIDPLQLDMLSGFAPATVAKSFSFQLINPDWSVRGNHEYLRSEPAVYACLFIEELQEGVNVRFNWYQADGRLFYSGESWLEPGYNKIWQGLWLETIGMSFILGSYSVEVTVTASGATVYEKQIDFDAIKKPTDPPGQYLEQEAMTSQDQPLGEEKTLFTFTDEQVFAALMYEYYPVEIDSATGFKMEWYYDEKESVYIPDFGFFSIPSPFQYSDPEIWTDEFEPRKFLYGLSDQLTLPDSINFLGTYLKGQWHVDFLIKIDRGDSEWQLVTSLPFTIDNEPPVVQITQPEEGYETEKAKLALLLGTASDNIGVEKVTWKNGDSQGTASGTDDWQVNNIPLHKDSNFITVKASDAAENEGEKTIKVIFNNSPPELSMEAPSVAIINEPYSLSLHASDINENLRDVTIHWGDGSSETKNISGSEADVAFAHAYNSGGIFPLTAVVTDEEDETAIAIQPVVVGDEVRN